MTGIVVSEYFLVKRGRYHVGDLYTGNDSSPYWYNAGFIFRGFTAWDMGQWSLLRKFFFP